VHLFISDLIVELLEIVAFCWRHWVVADVVVAVAGQSRAPV
jgi:hypothetical protein